MKKITNNTTKAKNFAKKDKYNSKNTPKFGGKNTKSDNKDKGSFKESSNKKNSNSNKNSVSASKSGGKAAVSKPKEGSFLYLLPENISAKELHGGLDFMDKKQLEVWTELNLLEVTADAGTVTFEDMRDNLSEEDFKTLDSLEIKKVYAVDYYLTDKDILHKIMEALISKFGGKIGSDTEDFQPFINVKEI